MMVKRLDWVFIAVLVVILLALYSGVLNSALIWDDAMYFRDNLLLGEYRPLAQAFMTSYFSEQIGITNVDHYYRPLLTLSFMIESRVWGIHPVALRIVNFLLFCLGVILFYRLLVLITTVRYIPEIGAILLAVHPVSADNILWVVARSDLLLLVFGLLSFLCLELYAVRKRSLYWAAGSASFLIGIFCKESFFLFWPALLVFEWSRRKRMTIPFHALNAASVAAFFVVKTGILGIRNPRFLTLPLLGEGPKILLGTVGYYVKSLVWPFAPRLFLPTTEARSTAMLLWGALTLLVLGLLVYLAVRDKAFAAPVAMLIIFVVGHAVMAFSSAFPYNIYARYAMVPWLAAAWILALLAGRLAEKTRVVPALVAVLVLLPTTYINARVYRTELGFWQTAAARAPRDSYVLYKTAKSYYDAKDIIRAELTLNRALSLSIRRETAILISQLYADIDIAKADYAGSRRWLGSIEEIGSRAKMAIADSVKYQVRQIQAKMAMLEGRPEEAEKLLREDIALYPDSKVPYTDLFYMYSGYEMWDKAERLGTEIAVRFPSFTERVAKMKEESNAPDADARVTFLVQHRNLGKAIQLLEGTPQLDLAHKILLARLLYQRGDEEKGKAAIGRITADPATDFKVLNSIAAFYLNDLYRVPEAVDFLNRSLTANPDQPQIAALERDLTENYLRKLNPVWR